MSWPLLPVSLWVNDTNPGVSCELCLYASPRLPVLLCHLSVMFLWLPIFSWSFLTRIKISAGGHSYAAHFCSSFYFLYFSELSHRKAHKSTPQLTEKVTKDTLIEWCVWVSTCVFVWISVCVCEYVCVFVNVCTYLFVCRSVCACVGAPLCQAALCSWSLVTKRRRSGLYGMTTQMPLPVKYLCSVRSCGFVHLFLPREVLAVTVVCFSHASVS